MIAKADWYDIRRASSRKPATYRCPFCGRRLTAMSEHAHIECVARARANGLLPTRSEWRAAQPRPARRWWPFSRG